MKNFIPSTVILLVAVSLLLPEPTTTCNTAYAIQALALATISEVNKGHAAVTHLTSGTRDDVYSHHDHHRRSADTDINDELEMIWEAVAKVDLDKCVERVFCELGTGKLESEFYVNLIETIVKLDEDTVTDSALREYIRAAKIGKAAKTSSTCVENFKCKNTATDLLPQAEKFLASTLREST